MTDPNKLIFNIFNSEITAILNDYRLPIIEAVNYGAHLLNLEIREKAKDDSLVPELFLRNFIDILDSVQFLISNGSGESIKILLRSLFEINLSIHFIAEKSGKNRSYSFLFVNTYYLLKDLDIRDEETKRGEDFNKKVKSEKWLPDKYKPLDNDTLSIEREHFKNYLSQDEFKEVKAEFDRIKSEPKNQKRRIKWHQLFGGAPDLCTLAALLEKSTIYEILYREWSNSTHGNNIIKNKVFEDSFGSSYIRAIGEPRGLRTLAALACNLAINSYGLYSHYRHPDRLNQFKEWESKFLALRNKHLASERINFIPQSEDD